MPVTKRQKLKMKERRKIVAERYLAGWTQARIAEHVGVTQQTVSLDLKALREEWVKQANYATEKRVGEHLEMLRLARDKFEEAGDWHGYMRTVESERKLLGLDAPQKKEVTGKDGKDLPPMVIIDFGDDD